MMEELANNSVGKEEFMTICDEAFEKFLKTNPPLIAEETEEAKSAFLEMMGTAYEMDPHKKVELKEEDVNCLHETGVRIHGFPDRMERTDSCRRNS